MRTSFNSKKSLQLGTRKLMQPEISLIVATRNRANSLKTLLDSLKKHGWLSTPSVEVLIIDNDPSDSSSENLCSSYSGLRYLRASERGKTNALNYGISQSSAGLIAFTDDDAIVDSKDWLFKMAAHFRENPNLGYVSGNVIAFETKTTAQTIWESKGGLSKGNLFKSWRNQELKADYGLKVWPLTEIFAGANSMIPRKVLLSIGLFNPLFGPGGVLPHGEFLELGYRIIRDGYDVLYDPNPKILHQHPDLKWDLQKKLFLYGRGDTSLHMYILLKYADLRSLWWALIGHQFRIVTRIIKSFRRKYPLPYEYLIFSLAGSILGPFFAIIKLPSFIRRQEILNREPNSIHTHDYD
jgi:glycosyltransferase involved in cell wall biosynthesis